MTHDNKNLSSKPNDTDRELEREKSALLRGLTRNLKRTVARVQELHQTFQTNQQWQQLAHEAILLQAHLYLWKKGMRQITVIDWENQSLEKVIDLDPTLAPGEEIQERICKSRKMERSLPHLLREIEKTENRKKSILQEIEQLDAINTLQEFEKLKPKLPHSGQPTKKAGKHTPKVRVPYHEFWSASGMQIWVGRKATDNDKLTFNLSNGNDYWLHIADYPGSHVVIKSMGKEPDQETLSDALQLALAHSKIKNHTEGEVIVTQCKFIARSGKNAPGKVQVSKHHRVYVKLSKERLDNVKRRTKLTGN